MKEPAFTIETIKCLWCNRASSVALSKHMIQNFRCFCGNVITITPLKRGDDEAKKNQHN
jgi:hypothetical protein